LEDIADSFYGTRKAIPWSVKVEPGSNVLVAIPGEPLRPEIRPKVISTALKNGLKVLKGGAKPEMLSSRALERVKSLADLSDRRGFNISIIMGKNKPQEISSKIRASLDDILRVLYFEVGTIEGHLRILAKRKRLEVEVVDDISKHLVHCIITPDQLEDAKEAFDRRVSVSGLIHYRADGTPVSIEVEEIFRFPFNRELPHHNDVRGILENAN
jgi:hypothetical protein